ncbi:hypothetical protein [Amycolatopsis pigmentata]|uniref:ABC transport system permease protein n=1 Tax=Amycolatopsis pigmentata TaxID=450801 RepID=A0ABW5G593_9PSEU
MPVPRAGLPFVPWKPAGTRGHGARLAGPGLVAGVLGVPLGVAAHDYVLLVHAAGTEPPPADLDVYGPGHLVALGLGGLVIASLAALLPAGRAAATRTATALRTE